MSKNGVIYKYTRQFISSCLKYGNRYLNLSLFPKSITVEYLIVSPLRKRTKPKMFLLAIFFIFSRNNSQFVSFRCGINSYLYGMNKILLFTLSCAYIAVLAACSSPQRLYEKGNFKAALTTLDYKARKGKLTQEEKSVYEKSLADYVALGNTQLRKSFASTSFVEWQEAYLSLDKLAEEQNKHLRLPQFQDSNIPVINIMDWDEKFAHKLNQHHLSAYEQNMENYLASEDKNELISGYYELDKIAHFARSTLNTDSLKIALEEKGKRIFSLNFSDDSFNMFELRHLEFYVRPSNQQWSIFDSKSKADYTVNIVLKELDKNEAQEENQQQYTNDVIVGYETVVDDNGDPAQAAILETYSADVQEVAFRFEIEASVEVAIIWNKTGEQVAYNYFTDTMSEEVYQAYLLTGDTRAIPPSVNLTNDNSNFTTLNYDYSSLIEDLLESISSDVEYYIEGY